MRQFKELTVEVLVDRLINRGVYWLAFEICRYLKLEGTQATSRVLVHWASSMISEPPSPLSRSAASAVTVAPRAPASSAIAAAVTAVSRDISQNDSADRPCRYHDYAQLPPSIACRALHVASQCL